MRMFKRFQTLKDFLYHLEQLIVFWALEKKAVSCFVGATILHVKVCPLSGVWSGKEERDEPLQWTTYMFFWQSNTPPFNHRTTCMESVTDINENEILGLTRATVSLLLADCILALLCAAAQQS